MINQGPDLGCPATDNGRPGALCLCGRAGFGYGLRDCSRQACGPGADAADAVSGVLAFGRSYCEEGMFFLLFFFFLPFLSLSLSIIYIPPKTKGKDFFKGKGGGGKGWEGKGKNKKGDGN